MIIHLGEVVIPYAEGGIDTGGVAEILEEKFGVMQVFADQNEEFIAGVIEAGIANALDNIEMGAPLGADLFAGAMAKIENRFHEYIDSGEHGIKTKSMQNALSGTRKKRQYRKVTGKTAFFDTGAYYRNFHAWAE